jgi:soluble lytic murein transglycosylase-like protein
MKRAQVACLALLCTLLVFDGAPAAPQRVEGPGAASSTLEVLVAEHLADLNPQLSRRQLDRISSAVLRNSEKYGLDPALVVAVISAESNARPWVRSPKGAVGLMQVMPYMMGSLDVAGNLTSIESNVEAGCMILADNIRRLGEAQGILAYFWGNKVRGVAYLERVSARPARLAGADPPG